MQERDINHYQEHYDHLPFEPTMAAVRRRMILELLNNRQAKNILEVGCGNNAIFNDYTGFDRMTVVEPSAVFFERASAAAAGMPEKKIVLIHDFFSDKAVQGRGPGELDTILISGLLHELADPGLMLRHAAGIAGKDTLVHVNVPNARSIHRLMAKEMGLLQDVKEKTALQHTLQQHHTFDIESLTELAAQAGFEVADSGTFFIKPFSHKQMEVLEQHPMFGGQVIRGFERLVKYLPDFGAEFYLNLRKR